MIYVNVITNRFKEEANSALAADGREVEAGHALVVKLSDPENRKSRDNPACDSLVSNFAYH